MRAIVGMRSSEIEDPEELMGFIPRIYEHESQLKRDEFITKLLEKESSWIFNENKIREKFTVFAKQDIQHLLEEELGDIIQ